MESVKSVAKDPVKKTQIDRVILDSDVSNKINKWIQDLNERTDGLIKFSKSDIVNFFIRSHELKLSESEICQISQDLFDETKWLGWALGKMKKANKSGQSLTFNELAKFRNDLMGGVSVDKIKRKYTKKNNQTSQQDLNIIED